MPLSLPANSMQATYDRRIQIADFALQLPDKGLGEAARDALVAGLDAARIELLAAEDRARATRPSSDIDADE